MAQTDSVARQRIRTPRAAAVAGIAFSVLLTLAFVLVRIAVHDEPDEPGSWVADDAKRTAVTVALNLLPFAGIAFLWFIGVVRDRIGQGEDRLFATVFLGSGLLLVAMLFVMGAIAGGLVATTEEFPATEVWSFGRRVSYTLLTVYAMRMAAVFAISTTTLASRLGLVPRWLAVLGLASGLILLLSAGVVSWIEVIFPAWVFVFSVHILFATLRTDEPESDGAAVTPS
ncbi:MAG: hypothetical protein ACRDX9_02165 [Acidimicrobiia bacterium]